MADLNLSAPPRSCSRLIPWRRVWSSLNGALGICCVGRVVMKLTLNILVLLIASGPLGRVAENNFKWFKLSQNFIRFILPPSCRISRYLQKHVEIEILALKACYFLNVTQEKVKQIKNKRNIFGKITTFDIFCTLPSSSVSSRRLSSHPPCSDDDGEVVDVDDVDYEQEEMMLLMIFEYEDT